MTEEICPWCGESFTKNIHNQKWCSPACKNKAYRQRKKQGKVNSRAIDVEKSLISGKILERSDEEIIQLNRPPSVIVAILRRKWELADKTHREVDKQKEDLNIAPELIKQFGDFLAEKADTQTDSEA